ncbi:MAG: hypothetical protein WCH83_12320 [Alphaproteobacteria bacterium]
MTPKAIEASSIDELVALAVLLPTCGFVLGAQTESAKGQGVSLFRLSWAFDLEGART